MSRGGVEGGGGEECSAGDFGKVRLLLALIKSACGSSLPVVDLRCVSLLTPVLQRV